MQLFEGLTIGAALAILGAAGCGDLVGVDFGAAHLGEAGSDATTEEDGGAGLTPDGSRPSHADALVDARADARDADARPGDAAASKDGAACKPKTCEALHATCGAHDDDCGGTLNCGTCASNEICVAGACNCQPTTCPALGATCGTEADGCGAALECGACLTSQTCTDNACACKPTTCAAMGFNCGSVPDGCGNMLDCTVGGGCAGATPYCGGGGPNVCGPAPCTPTTCAAAGKNCGTLSDGCGGMLACGACTAPETCAGGGAANVCGCTPTTCATIGANCGTPPDGCGGTLDCGTQCATDETCAGGGTAYVCGCTPTTCAALGDNCGAPANGCGGTLSCGGCTSPEVCDVGQCCRPKICTTCGEGSIPNGCGGEAVCPICTCFGAGTDITMEGRTHRAIESIRVGERVLGYDGDRGGWVPVTVTHTFTHEAHEGTGTFIVVNGSLRLTSNHPVWTRGHAVPAEALVLGDPIVVLSADGVPVTTPVRTLERVPSHEVTYDLDVDGPGTFIAGGVVVVHKLNPNSN